MDFIILVRLIQMNSFLQFHFIPSYIFYYLIDMSFFTSLINFFFLSLLFFIFST